MPDGAGAPSGGVKGAKLPCGGLGAAPPTSNTRTLSPRVERALLGAILALYLALASLYALRTPAWQAPDEPAHYNYVRQIAETERLPVLEMGDWQQAYQEELKASGFQPSKLGRLGTIQYEDHQPPLYYLLQTPVYALTDGDLRAMRLFSALLGLGVVWGAWAVTRRVFPRRPALALTAAGFVAFLPQHLAVLGSVNNDALAELLTAFTLLAAVAYVRGERVSPLALGGLVGLAFLTKSTVYFLAGVAGVAVLWRGHAERWTWGRTLRALALLAAPALALGALWWGRNLAVYGGVDVLGLQRHDAITVGQLRTADYIRDTLGGSTRAYAENLLVTTFHSFWGQFGWMALPMPAAVYRVLWAATLIVGAGALGAAWHAHWPRTLTAAQRGTALLFAATLGAALAQFLYYNVEFVQFQGRYLYPALIPLAVVWALGWCGLAIPLERARPVWGLLLPLGVVAGQAVFAWYALETYIVPNLPAW